MPDLYLEIAGPHGPAGPEKLGNNAAVMRFHRWVESLPLGDFDGLRQLSVDGSTCDSQRLVEEIARGQEVSTPDERVRVMLAVMAEAIDVGDAGESVGITDGGDPDE